MPTKKPKTKGLKESDYKEILKELDSCARPLFFYHDDPDGLCSFLQLYAYKKDGHGVAVKSTPCVDEKFLRKVDEYCPDCIFILDVAKIDSEFIKKANTKIVMIDHHDVLDIKGIKYFNPREYNPDENIPCSYLCYQIVKRFIPDRALWYGMVGCVGDWYLPDFKTEFSKKYPELLSNKVKKPEVALFATDLGKLVEIFSFLLKTRIKDVKIAISVILKIEDPRDIVNSRTKEGKFLYKKAKHIGKPFFDLLKLAKENTKKDGGIVEFIYQDTQSSFTKELANFLLYENPKKLIIIGREKSGEMKLSIRSAVFTLPGIIEKSLKNVQGYGGGHEHACGACVKKEDYSKFISNIKKQVFLN